MKITMSAFLLRTYQPKNPFMVFFSHSVIGSPKIDLLYFIFPLFTNVCLSTTTIPFKREKGNVSTRVNYSIINY
jgi:hypothetical protein